MNSIEVLQLRDIHLPASPDFWPPALGWWLLLSLILLISFWLIIKAKQRKRKQEKYQQFFSKLVKLEDKLRKQPNNETLAEFNILLRQLAINHYSRTKIASLTGGDWLHFLDESGRTHDFSKGSGRILIDAPYRSGNLQNLNIDEFISLIRNWVSKIVKMKGGVL